MSKLDVVTQCKDICASVAVVNDATCLILVVVKMFDESIGNYVESASF